MTDLQGKILYNSACLFYTWEIPRERWGNFPPFLFTCFVSRIILRFIYGPVYILVIFFFFLKRLSSLYFSCIKTPQLVATADAWDLWIKTGVDFHKLVCEFLVKRLNEYSLFQEIGGQVVVGLGDSDSKVTVLVRVLQRGITDMHIDSIFRVFNRMASRLWFT